MTMYREPFNTFWDIGATAEYIVSRVFRVIALQFPDDLLKDATAVAGALTLQCRSKGHEMKAFVMADTTYNSLGVDEVAAQHVNAQCVIHYGRASLSPLSKLPAYLVFTRQPLDCPRTSQRIAEWASQACMVKSRKALVLLPDQALAWALQGLSTCLTADLGKAKVNLEVTAASIPSRVLDPTSDGLVQLACPQSSSAAPEAARAPAVPAHPTGNMAQGDLQQSACTDSANGQAMSADLSISGAPQHPAQTPCWGQSEGLPAIQGLCSSSSSVLQQSAQPAAFQDQAEGSLDAEVQGRGRHMEVAGLQWDLPEGVEMEDCILLWLGELGTPAMTQLMFTYSGHDWAVLDPETEDGLLEGVPADIRRSQKRRNFLIEKARNASIIGIVVGTLGVAGFLQAEEGVRRLARGAGKQTYTVLMGKPNPAKLANFPEVEVWVMVADAQGQIMDSKEFYAPIITPHEAQLAFSPQETGTSGPYRQNFAGLLEEPQASLSSHLGAEASSNFSVVHGGHHSVSSGMAHGNDLALAQHTSRTLHLRDGLGQLAEIRSAAQYLNKCRSYRGLETPYTGAAQKEAAVAVQGRSGRAARYADEPVA